MTREHDRTRAEALEVVRGGGPQVDEMITEMERMLEEAGGLETGFFHVQFKDPRRFTWLLVAFASMGGLLSGLDQSLISGANLYLPDDLGLDTHQNSLVNSGMPLGAVGGALLLSPVNEYFGRKNAILISVILYTIGAGLEAGSINFGMCSLPFLFHSLFVMLPRTMLTPFTRHDCCRSCYPRPWCRLRRWHCSHLRG